MRISDHRYSRDRLRLDLALRFIHHEARTRTIRSWTGLTDDRIRKLYRSYLKETGHQLAPRHRGKSPGQASFFTRSPRAQQESALLASLCCLLGVVPPRVLPQATRTLPSIARGELLCQAFEAFRALTPESPITFEHAVFLVTALSRGDELKLVSCVACGSLVVMERLSVIEPRCQHCLVHQPWHMAPPADVSGHA